MLTISQLAKKNNVSRSTILYYEKVGLLKPKFVADNGYRWYGVDEEERLKLIVSYRSYQLPVSDICNIFDSLGESQSKILEKHFEILEVEINNLRKQQIAIIELFKKSILLKEKSVDKSKWVEIMLAAGLSKEDMIRWHQKFEEMEPEEHQKFLESLNISCDEIAYIRSL